MAITELKKRADATDDAIARLDERVTKHDEIIAVLCDSLATKDDIASLHSAIRERHGREDLQDERIDFYKQQLDALHAAQTQESHQGDSRFNRRMSWAMLAMFVWECGLTWIGMKHGK